MNILNSVKLFERAKRVSPGGVHSPVRAFRGVGGNPVFIESAKGSKLRDVDGNHYIDFCSSWGPLILGHQDEEVKSEVIRSLERGWSFGATEEKSLALAEWILERIPFLDKIRFVNSGTEALMSAIRLAKGATGRSKVIKFEGCYHGHVDSMLVKAGSGLAEMSSPDSAGISKAVAAETIVVPLNDIEKLSNAFEMHGSDIAAVVMEAVPANNGLLLQTTSFYSKLIELTKKNNSLLIWDEVITGFRVALGGMATKLNISPDIVCYGKIIGGGFPVGAYAGKKEIMDLIAPLGPVYQAGTLSANPVAMTAGLATLKKIDRDKVIDNLEVKTSKLCQEMESLVRKYGRPISVQKEASIFWTVLGEVKTKDGVVRAIQDIPGSQKEKYAKVFHQMLESGIYLAPSGFEVSFLSNAHTDKDLDFFLTVFEKTLSI